LPKPCNTGLWTGAARGTPQRLKLGYHRGIMRALIVGCGQVGSELATALAMQGMDLAILDRDEDAFLQLPEDFAGATVVGDGLDEEALRRAGIEEAGIFVVATAEDNYNLMVAQFVKMKFKVSKIIVRVYDPDKAALFADLSLQTYCPTKETAIAIERLIKGEGK